MIDLHNRSLLMGLRAAQGLLAILVLGLTGYVASWMGDNRIYGAPSEVSFLLFCSIWTLIAIAFLLVVSVKFASTIASHAYALLAVEAVTMLFWFAGFIALAVYIGGKVCYGSVCSSAKASIALGAFSWQVSTLTLVLWAVTFGLAVIGFLKSRRTTSTFPAHTSNDVSMHQGV